MAADAPAPSVFILLGHGQIHADLPPVEIPKGVILISQAVCGDYTVDNDQLIHTRNLELKEFYLQAPYPKTSEEQLTYNQSLYRISAGGGIEKYSAGSSLMAEFEGDILPDASIYPYNTWGAGYHYTASGIRRLYVNAAENASLANNFTAEPLTGSADILAKAYEYSLYPTKEQVAERDPETYKKRTFIYKLSEVFDDIRTNGGRKFNVSPPEIAADGTVLKHVVLINPGCRRFAQHRFTMARPYRNAGSVTDTRKFEPVAQVNVIPEINSKTIEQLMAGVDENGNTPLMANIQAGNYDAAHRLLVRITNKTLQPIGLQKGWSVPTSTLAVSEQTLPKEEDILEYIALRNRMGQSALDLAILAEKQTIAAAAASPAADKSVEVAVAAAAKRLLLALQPLSLPIGFMNPQNQPAKRNADAAQARAVSNSSINDLLAVSKNGVTYLMTLLTNAHCDAAALWFDRMARAVESGELDAETFAEYVNKRSILGKDFSVLHYLEDNCPLRRDISDAISRVVNPEKMISIYEAGVLVYTEGASETGPPADNSVPSPISTVNSMSNYIRQQRRQRVRDEGGNMDISENEYRIEGTQIVRILSESERDKFTRRLREFDKKAKEAANAAIAARALEPAEIEAAKAAEGAETAKPWDFDALFHKVFVGKSDKGFQDGPAAEATFHTPVSLCYDKGSMYIIDGRRIRVIEKGIVKTIAGNGARGHQDGDGFQATFQNPTRINVTPEGDIEVTDGSVKRIIRRISRNFMIFLNILSNPDTSDDYFSNTIYKWNEIMQYGGVDTFKGLKEVKAVSALTELLKKYRSSVYRCIRLINLLKKIINHHSFRTWQPLGLLAMGKPSDKLFAFNDSRTIEDNIKEVLETEVVPMINLYKRKGDPNSENSKNVAKTEVIATVIEAIRTHIDSADLCAQGLSFLMWFTFIEKGRKFIKDNFGYLPFLELIVAVLRRHMDYEWVSVSATTILASLSEVPELRYALYRIDGFNALLSAVIDKKIGNANVNSAFIYKNLSKDTAIAKILYTSQNMSLFIKLLQAAITNKNMCNQILLLLTNDSLTDDMIEFLISPPSPLDGIMPLLKIIFDTHGSNKEVCENACSLLARLTTVPEVQLQSRQLIPAIIKCMKDYSSSVTICRRATTILSNISLTNRDWIRDAVPYLVKMATTHKAQCSAAATLLQSLGFAETGARIGAATPLTQQNLARPNTGRSINPLFRGTRRAAAASNNLRTVSNRNNSGSGIAATAVPASNESPLFGEFPTFEGGRRRTHRRGRRGSRRHRTRRKNI
jgi:hypothetical protein